MYIIFSIHTSAVIQYAIHTPEACYYYRSHTMNRHFILQFKISIEVVLSVLIKAFSLFLMTTNLKCTVVMCLYNHTSVIPYYIFHIIYTHTLMWSEQFEFLSLTPMH